VFNPLEALMGLFSLDMGIDLGTANTLVYVRGKGIVINEPSWVALDARTRRPLKVGAEAKEMVGKTPANIIAVRPLRDGVISEFILTEEMLRQFIQKVHQKLAVRFPRPRVVIGVPSGVTEVEMRAVKEAALNAGARQAYLIEEPIAAAIGAGLPITEPQGSMVVDIGGGTTEVAVFALSGIVISRSIRIAGDELDEDIVNYARQKYNLTISERMAERLKINIGSAYPLPEEKTMMMRGRNLVTGLPEQIEVSSIEIREAIARSVNVIIELVRNTLDETPPELISDLIETGIVLTGGGALLKGLPERIQEEVHIKARPADDPLTCVARGAGAVLEHFDVLERTLSMEDWEGGGSASY